MKKHLPALTFILLLTADLQADPTFVTSTFDTGNDGWQPNSWQTTTVGGLTPGNPYLKIAADGSGPLGKMITFNANSEWTGDYFSAGVTGLQLDIANKSDSDDVYLRIAVGNRVSPMESEGTWWISKTAVLIPLETSWNSIFLSLEENDLVRVGNLMGQLGTDSYPATFGDIRNIRILSAAVPLGPIGDEFVGDVGMDNIALVPEPGTVSLIGLGATVMALYRKRKPTVSDPSMDRREKYRHQLDLINLQDHSDWS